MSESTNPIVNAAPKNAERWWDRGTDWFVRLLDDRWTIPGTNIRFGLDSLLGLFLPAAGDAATGVGSLGLLAMALRQGVPSVVLMKMVGNLAIDVVVGAVPFFGDAFDVVWRSNRRNLKLIREYSNPDKNPSAIDYAWVMLGVVLAIASIVVPIAIVVYLGIEWGPKLFG